MLFLANEVLRNRTDPSWRFYFMLCIGGYRDLFPFFRVALGIVQGLLMIAIGNGAISDWEAQLVLDDFRGLQNSDGGGGGNGERSGGFVVDLDLAMTDIDAAGIDRLVERFEEATAVAAFTQGITGAKEADGAQMDSTGWQE